MKKFILFAIIAVLLLSTGVAYLWQTPYGYVLIDGVDWQIEHSLSRFVVVLSAGFLALYIVVRLLIRLLFLPSTIRGYTQRKRQEQARKNIIQGLIHIIEGRPKRAEKVLLKNIAHSDTQLLNYLLAARAAQLEDADERRDEYLKLAHKTTPAADLAIGLTQAELQLAHNQTEQALATLTRLREIAPQHIYVLKLLVRLYMQLKEWEKLIKLLPDIRKHGILPEERLLGIERAAYSAYLRATSKQGDYGRLREQWRALPRHYRQDGDILHVYVECLLKAGQHDDAELLLRRALAVHWHENLARLYGLVKSTDLNKQLQHAETWKREHGRSAMLLLSLARLSYRLRLWGKARVYFESSIAITPGIEAYKELGELLITLGETENAYQCWREGLNLAIKHAGLSGVESIPASNGKRNFPPRTRKT